MEIISLFGLGETTENHITQYGGSLRHIQSSLHNANGFVQTGGWCWQRRRVELNVFSFVLFCVDPYVKCRNNNKELIADLVGILLFLLDAIQNPYAAHRMTLPNQWHSATLLFELKFMNSPVAPRQVICFALCGGNDNGCGNGDCHRTH